MVVAERMTVTPAMAREWLEGKVANRSLSPLVVARYAEDMRHGRWLVNGETLKFGEDGRLFDGQHRLHAVVAANTPVEMLTFRGDSAELMATIDSGRKRSLGDQLRLRGHREWGGLAAAISHLFRWEHRRTFVRSCLCPGDSPTVQEALLFLDRHPGLEACLESCGGRSRNAVLRGGLGAALYFILSGVDAKDCEHFFKHLNSGAALEDGSPILALRTRLMARPAFGRSLATDERAALTFKAWNLFRRGDKVKVVSWRKGGAAPEPFPIPE
jgi:hypothetical protein